MVVAAAEPEVYLQFHLERSFSIFKCSKLILTFYCLPELPSSLWCFSLMQISCQCFDVHTPGSGSLLHLIAFCNCSPAKQTYGLLSYDSEYYWQDSKPQPCAWPYVVIWQQATAMCSNMTASYSHVQSYDSKAWPCAVIWQQATGMCSHMTASYSHMQSYDSKPQACADMTASYGHV